MIRRIKRWWCKFAHSSPHNLLYVGNGTWECRKCWQRVCWPSGGK